MPLCYKIMDLPKVPREYVDFALNLVKEVNDPYKNQQNLNPQQEGRIITKGGITYASRTNPRYSMENIMGKWVNDNITEEWSHVSVANNIPSPKTVGQGTPTIHGPHSDQTRSYLLLYLIESTNPDQDTIFYQEPDRNLYRKRNTTILDLDTVTEIDRVRIPLYTWVYMNTSILHGVENIQGIRTALHVGFDCDPLGVFVK